MNQNPGMKQSNQNFSFKKMSNFKLRNSHAIKATFKKTAGHKWTEVILNKSKKQVT